MEPPSPPAAVLAAPGWGLPPRPGGRRVSIVHDDSFSYNNNNLTTSLFKDYPETPHSAHLSANSSNISNRRGSATYNLHTEAATTTLMNGSSSSSSSSSSLPDFATSTSSSVIGKSFPNRRGSLHDQLHLDPLKGKTVMWVQTALALSDLVDAAEYPPQFEYGVTGIRRKVPRPPHVPPHLLGRTITINNNNTVTTTASITTTTTTTTTSQMSGDASKSDGNNQRITLFRYGEKVFAMDATCPHNGAEMDGGDIEDYKQQQTKTFSSSSSSSSSLCIVCPRHGFVFQLDSGISQVPKGTFTLGTYEVRLVPTLAVSITDSQQQQQQGGGGGAIMKTTLVMDSQYSAGESTDSNSIHHSLFTGGSGIGNTNHDKRRGSNAATEKGIITNNNSIVPTTAAGSMTLSTTSIPASRRGSALFTTPGSGTATTTNHASIPSFPPPPPLLPSPIEKMMIEICLPALDASLFKNIDF